MLFRSQGAYRCGGCHTRIPENTYENDVMKLQGMYYQVLVMARVVSEERKINPQFRFAVMLSHITTYPLTPDPRDMIKT